MNTLVLYESEFGNTRKLAEQIGKELSAQGPVRVAGIAEYDPAFLAGVDLFVLGAPTQAHGVSQRMKEFLTRLQSRPAGIRAAVFDTRVKGPMLLWGSAARAIAPQLETAGFKLVVPPENFVVTFSRPPELEAGAEEQAAKWAGALVALVAGRPKVAA